MNSSFRPVDLVFRKPLLHQLQIQIMDSVTYCGKQEMAESPFPLQMDDAVNKLLMSDLDFGSQDHLLRATGCSPVSSCTSVNAYEASPLSQPMSHSCPSSLLLPYDSLPEVAPTDMRGGAGAPSLDDYFTLLDSSKVHATNGFGEAMNILGADGMRVQSQHQFQDHWQQVNRPSPMENTGARSRASYLSSAGRYSQCSVFGLPPQARDLVDSVLTRPSPNGS